MASLVAQSWDSRRLPSGIGFPRFARDLQRLRLSDVFPSLVDIANGRLIDQEIGAAVSAQLDAVFVVPLDGSLYLIAIFHHDHDRGFALHLLLVIKILGVGLVRS